MIKRIEIENIQAHEKTTINLRDGITAITGSSDSGKTAIFRALNWIFFNRPLGSDILASHWARDSKGVVAKPVSATIELSDGAIVTRRRTKTENQYIVTRDGETQKYDAVRGDVPDDVKRVLKINSTNVQNQLDAPFLLSSTAGDVAKYFNGVVNLDVIDASLSRIDSMRRENKREIERAEKTLAEKKSALEKMDWIDRAKNAYAEYKKVADAYDATVKNRESLATLIKTVKRMKRALPPIDGAREAIEIYENIENEIAEVSRRKKTLSALHEKITDALSREVAAEKVIAETELPETCPTCGAAIGV